MYTRSLFFHDVMQCKLVVSYSSPGPRQCYFLLVPPPESIFTFSTLHPTALTPQLTKQLSSSLQLSPQPHRTHLPTMLLIPQFSGFSFSLLYFFTSLSLLTLFYWSISPPLLHLAVASHSQGHFPSQHLLGNSNYFLHLLLPLPGPPRSKHSTG
jgi:hypothetical protein